MSAVMDAPAGRTVRIGASAARIYDLSDKEILWILDDVADEEGYGTIGEMADQLGLRHDHPTRCLSTRMGRMRTQYDLVEKHPQEPYRWRISARGQKLLNAHLRATQTRTLEGLTEDQMLEVTAFVTQRFRSADPIAGALIRREWQHGTYLPAYSTNGGRRRKR